MPLVLKGRLTPPNSDGEDTGGTLRRSLTAFLVHLSGVMGLRGKSLLSRLEALERAAGTARAGARGNRA